MQIKISNATVEIRDRISHKAHKAYNSTLLRDVEFDEEGNPINVGAKGSLDAVSAAAEAFALAMISNIIPDDGSEPHAASAEWLDSIDEDDFKKIDEALRQIKLQKEKEVKNGSGRPGDTSSAEGLETSPTNTQATQ